MTTTDTLPLPFMHRSAARVVGMLLAGLVAAGVSIAFGLYGDAVVIGWIAAALVYTIWTWLRVRHDDAEQTARRATREDPSRGASELLILLASLASIAAVVVVLLGASDQTGSARFGAGALGVVSLALSWVLVHTLFTLRYASLYYRNTPGGIDFNQKERPRYSDFAYLSFTIGMTYQVSDTTFESSDFRSAALRHALLSYLFGAVILAATVNLVAGLAS